MVRISFHSVASMNAFLRTSGIQACEIIAKHECCIDVTESNIDWSNNSHVYRVAAI